MGNPVPAAEREARLARLMAAGPALAKTNHIGHCEVGQKLAATLGFEPHIQHALLDMYERWDGKGDVTQHRGEAIPLAVRIAHVAQDAATFGVNDGVASAVEVVRARAGRMLDPAIADFADLKSPFTVGHSRRVADLAARSARQASLPDGDVREVRCAGLMQDVGRVGVSSSIWAKPDRLSDTEWERVRLHPLAAADVFCAMTELCRMTRPPTT
jgi:HD-GYP domain-containing protein (c-di-GMP phosphodiesterase class II)